MSETGVLLLVVAGIVILWLWSRQTSLEGEVRRASEEGNRARAEVTRLSGHIQDEANKRFDEWRSREYETVKQQQTEVATREARIKLDEWRGTVEEDIRADARQRSQSTIIGKVTEHLVPYFPTFEYNPKDARFLGSPVDFVVFDGLGTDSLTQIVFVEVKTGAGSLTTRERQVRDAVLDKRIVWKELRVDLPAAEPLTSPPTLQAGGPSPRPSPAIQTSRMKVPTSPTVRSSVSPGPEGTQATRVPERPAPAISPESAVVGCSLCGARNRVSVESLGKLVRCGSCKREMKISSASFS